MIFVSFELLCTHMQTFASSMHTTSSRWGCVPKSHLPTQPINMLLPPKCFFFPEGGVDLVPKRECLLTLAYYAFPRWYGFGERRWNYILTRENRRIRRKTCPSATPSTTNPAWIDPGVKPGFRGDRPATNDLSHGTALPKCINFMRATKRRKEMTFYPKIYTRGKNMFN
jgi:hypothetical protein